MSGRGAGFTWGRHCVDRRGRSRVSRWDGRSRRGSHGVAASRWGSQRSGRRWCWLRVCARLGFRGIQPGHFVERLPLIAAVLSQRGQLVDGSRTVGIIQLVERHPLHLLGRHRYVPQLLVCFCMCLHRYSWGPSVSGTPSERMPCRRAPTLGPRPVRARTAFKAFGSACSSRTFGGIDARDVSEGSRRMTCRNGLTGRSLAQGLVRNATSVLIRGFGYSGAG